MLGDRHGGLTALRRAGMHDPAPQPEADRSRAEPIADARLARANRRGGDAHRPRGRDTTAWALSNSWSTRQTQSDDAWFAFIEANPRLQVEHTVTEEVFDVDLVAAQIRVAAGASLADLGLDGARAPRGLAIQARVNLETMTADGEALPAGGRIAAFDPPSGPGVRVDTFGYSGYRTSAAFDSLIAKVIVHTAAPDFRRRRSARRRARSANSASRASRPTSRSLQALLAHPDFVADRIDTRFIETHLAELLAGARAESIGASISTRRRPTPATPGRPRSMGRRGRSRSPRRCRARRVARRRRGRRRPPRPADRGDRSDEDGASRRGARRRDRARDARPQGRRALQGRRDRLLEPADVGAAAAEVLAADPDAIRPDLAEMLARQAFGFDENRPEAVARRRKTNQRTARENVAALVDPGSFIEYGSLAVAAQAARRSREDLIRNTPGDGVIAGLATVNGDLFGADRARCVVVAYDYTVLAGTQGARNHKKQDRLFDLAERAAPAGRPVRRGRRRPAGRHRRARRHRPRRADLRAIRAAQRPGAAGRRRLRPLLRRQRRAARLLRRRSSPPRIPRSAWAARR